LQRLPIRSIKRAQVIGKVILDKHPALAHFGSRYTASLGAAAEFFGMQLEKSGSLFKIKRLHDGRPNVYGTHEYRSLKPSSVP
jgi:hypothetical protein